jgi:general secretion pathway protein G
MHTPNSTDLTAFPNAVRPARPAPALERSAARTRSAFTLLEMVLVAVLIAALATIVVVNIAEKSNKAKVKFTIATLAQIKSQLIEYNTDFGTFPPALTTLVTAGKGYIEKVPLDGFLRPLNYQFPGASGESKHPYELYSNGVDGIQGTPDDIDIWTMSEIGPSPLALKTRNPNLGPLETPISRPNPRFKQKNHHPKEPRPSRQPLTYYISRPTTITCTPHRPLGLPRPDLKKCTLGSWI